MLLRYTNSTTRLKLLQYCVVAVGTLHALFGIGRAIFERGSQTPVIGYLFSGVGYGIFINRNHFAYMMEMTLGVLIGLVFSAETRNKRALYLSLTSIVWIALISCNSRGGIVSMLGVVVAALALYFFSRPRRAEQNQTWLGRLGKVTIAGAASGVLVAVLIVGVAVVGGDVVAGRMETIGGEVSAASESRMSRAQIWSSTYRLIADNKYLGVGFGAYPMAITRYDRGPGALSLEQAHNDYLETLANGGLIGAILVLCFIGVLVYRIRQTLRTRDQVRRAIGIGAAAGIAGVAIHSAFDFGLHITANAVMFTALIVLATARNSDDEAGPRHRRRRRSRSREERASIKRFPEYQPREI
jgi:O-antigen ligase